MLPLFVFHLPHDHSSYVYFAFSCLSVIDSCPGYDQFAFVVTLIVLVSEPPLVAADTVTLRLATNVKHITSIRIMLKILLLINFILSFTIIISFVSFVTIVYHKVFLMSIVIRFLFYNVYNKDRVIIMSNIHVEIGNRIRSFRTNKGLSQEKLAELSELNTSYIGQIERGEKNPSVDTVHSITAALGIELSGLFKHLSSSSDNSSYAHMVYSLMLSMDEKHSKYLFDLATLFAEK